MSVPPLVIDLVERFRRNEAAYRSGLYNETQVRREFIDPFFECLGWDVNNRQGYAEAYKDVVHEDSLDVAGVKRAPDYCFRIGGTRKFFLEAKKPSVNLHDDISPAYQLRRYAWTAKLPIGILTDFEELAVYDGRIKPAPVDKASTARVLYLHYTDYPERWDELEAKFARESILRGAFDKYADTAKGKRGTATVDVAFLAEIEAWRDQLARNIALRNPNLDQRGLNDAVQRTIDRIIFLRLCEDRGIEDYGQLQKIGGESDIYDTLKRLFVQADYRYNSGLFHFESEKGRPNPDNVSLDLAIDDKVLKPILRSLYYPDSPYEFSVMPADILGQVYEQFLGKVIRLTPGHQAKVEEKPEVRKAGGVYYTPTYIVDYIVQHTVGALLEGKTPRDVDGSKKNAPPLRVLDPACGSGSFLIVAYQYLLDWYRDQYIAEDAEKYCNGKMPKLRRIGERDYALTVPERKRILLDHIYGVDIDTQAVEVTKLSLLLKVIEGETAETLGQNRLLFQERALPDLDKNIKCGNSLIGPDYYTGQQTDAFNMEEIMRVNAFDWYAEFPEIMNNGRFDIVIGNPPYGTTQSKPEQKYFETSYRHQDYQYDHYLLFLERYLLWLRSGSILGVIVSNTWLQSLTFQNIRKYMTTSYEWERVLHIPIKIFKAVVDTHVLILRRCDIVPNESQFIVDVLEDGRVRSLHSLDQHQIPSDGTAINIVASPEHQSLADRIFRNSLELKNIFNVYNGAKPFEKGKGSPPQTAQTLRDKPYVKKGAKPNEDWKPLLRGSLIRRYSIEWNNDYWILYGPMLAAPRDPEIFNCPLKIMVRQTGDSIIATLVEGGYIGRDNLHILLPKLPDYDLRYVLGIMNSRLIDFCYGFMNPEKGEALAQVKKKHVERLPISHVDFSKQQDKTKHDKMVTFVQRMLDLHKLLRTVKSDHERTLLERQITATDRQIDQLVYALYGLTDEEIALVEGKG